MADHIGRHVLEDGAARADHGIAMYGDAGCDEDVGGDPGAVLDDDGFAADGKFGQGRVVIAGAQIASLGDHGMLADLDVGQAIKDYVIADPGIVADADFPGIGNAGAGPDHQT